MKFFDDRPVAEQIGSGVLITLKFLIGYAVIGVMFYGLDLFWFPQRRSPEHLAGRHPFVLGTILLAIVAVILNYTIQRWVTVLPGILAYCIFGGLLAIISGRIPNTRLPFPRQAAVYLTAYMVIATILTLTFAKRRLTVMDRVALTGFVFCTGISMLSNNPFYVYVVPAMSVCLLLPPWFVARKRLQMEELMAYRRRHHIPERLYRPHSWTFKN